MTSVARHQDKNFDDHKPRKLVNRETISRHIVWMFAHLKLARDLHFRFGFFLAELASFNVDLNRF